MPILNQEEFLFFQNAVEIKIATSIYETDFYNVKFDVF